MEYWEATLERAQKTQPVWQTHFANLKIGARGLAELIAAIAGFAPLVTARVAAQHEHDLAFREVQMALSKMRVISTAVPVLIEGHLEENEALMDQVDDLYRVQPRTEATILKRARELVPVWKAANAAMAALTPPQPVITRAVQGVALDVAALEKLLVDYAGLIEALEKKEEVLNSARSALRAHDKAVDRLNKRFYAMAKRGTEIGAAAQQALKGIPVEGGTPVPEPVEIAAVTQGGEAGLQVLVAYVPNTGAHATHAEIEYTVSGDKEPWQHRRPLDPSGNALGPFKVEQEIELRTFVKNSAGERHSAARKIRVGKAID